MHSPYVLTAMLINVGAVSSLLREKEMRLPRECSVLRIESSNAN